MISGGISNIFWSIKQEQERMHPYQVNAYFMNFAKYQKVMMSEDRAQSQTIIQDFKGRMLCL